MSIVGQPPGFFEMPVCKHCGDEIFVSRRGKLCKTSKEDRNLVYCEVATSRIDYGCLDTEGKRDWLDGWHQAGFEDFKMTFVSKRSRRIPRPHLGAQRTTEFRSSGELLQVGFDARETVMAERGI